MVSLQKVFVNSGVRYLFQCGACQRLNEVGFMNPHVGCGAVAKVEVLLHLLHYSNYCLRDRPDKMSIAWACPRFWLDKTPELAVSARDPPS